MANLDFVKQGDEFISQQSKELFGYYKLQKAINETLNPSGGRYSAPEVKQGARNFWNIFETKYTGSREVQKEENGAVKQFLEELRTKGATKYLADLNAEKIEKLVEEYEAKLLKSLGNSPEALK